MQPECFHSVETYTELERKTVDNSIPARFERIVQLYPDRLAVKDKDRSLTYDQLNRTANRIARAIIENRGPGSEPIGLLFGHEIDAIAAVMGVLKAGKFYVVLDPSFPQERLEYMLQDSETPIVLVNRHSFELGEVIAKSRSALLNIDELELSFSSENLGVRILPADLVNIRYTSGSTGVPKGVTRSHGSSSNVADLMHVSPDDRLSLVHSLSFGSSAMDFCVSLLNGAALVLFDLKSEGVQQLARWLSDEQITVCHLPPDLFRQLAEEVTDPQDLSHLRLVRLSGASINRREFDLYRNHFPSTTLLEIGMGSTEAGRICAASLTQTFSFPDEGTPIGYPVKGIEMLLLGEDGRQVSLGEIGEIALSGPSLAFGYWKEPELTNAKFLSDPTDANRTIYLTGDLGQMLPDGFLIHRGRKDLTVKIRGYRVNFSEVEAVLLKHTQVKEAAVAAWDRSSGEKYLAGYVVRRDEAALDVSELNKFLRSSLPDYMIPSTVIFLESLPLTNGKLNRHALPEPDNRRPDLKAPYVSPGTDVEKRLSRIWSELLSFDRVGVQDNFFDLGGHSLTASRLISRVLDSFQVDLPLKSLFESPTLAGFAQRVEDALHEGSYGAVLPLISVPRDESLPASFAQQAFWFHDQLEPGSCAYNFPVLASYLSGELDVKTFEQSINQIIDRHEVLRTVFHAIDGQPVPIVLPAMRIEVQIIDESFAASEQTRESEVFRIAGQLAGQPFDLTRGPLVRIALLRLASDEYVLLLVVHQIVFDAWSTGIFCRELSQIYNCLKNNQPSPLAPLRIQYSDFAVWQRGRLQGAILENHILYWRKQLEGLSTLRLPIARSKLESDGYGNAREEFRFSKELLAKLQSLNEHTGTTLFMVLLASYQIVLQRYTGQTDISIGTPTAGRNHPQVEGLIGCFLNMLVLRTDLSGNPTFRELLERVRKVCVDGFTHQDLPFEKIVEELQPNRDLASNPLFQITFALQNTPKCPLDLMGVTAHNFDVSAGLPRTFDLHLFTVEEVSGLRGYISYKTSLFQANVIRRLISHLENILMSIVENPEQRVSELPLLTASEKHQLLIEWNDTERDYPKGKCIHEFFEEQTEKTPDAIAMVFEDQQLTYRELNRRANQLAHYLRKLRVGPEVLVGICMERSLEMIIGLLGILKAGGAYVPLDPDYPQERLVFMLKDSRACLLLTQKSLVEDGRWRIEDGDSRSSIPSTLLRTGLDSRLKVVCLDSEWETIARESREKPSSGVTAENLAYIIYTSGSTGRPKGVAIEHHSTVALLSWAQTVFSAEEMAGVLASTSICFDLSVFELFGPLTSGGQVILAADAIALPGLVAASPVTLINTVPSAITELLRAKAIPSSVCTICLAGEPLMTGLVKDLYEQTSATKVYDLYGPSEDTTYSTFALRTKAGPQTVGRPISNTEAFILDRQRQPVPIGVCGELYIGGAGLARGYLNQPELTAEKFIPNPFSDKPGARLYRTGDLARYLPEGNIEFLGRIDNQVKIRGYRIELGEIEAVLSQHPTVLEAVMVARDDALDKRLVVYVVHRNGADISVNELREFLKQKLPQHMIPSTFMVLNALPLSPNGKVDRKALAAPDQSRPELEQGYQAPRTPMEEMLAEIWREVLKLQRVGIRDNFFDLGGHSLLATQVISRICGVLQLELPVRALFEAPTVAELAEQIEQARRTEPRPQTVPLLPVSRDKDLPLSFAQQRLWFLDQLEPESTAYHVPWVLRLRGPLNVSALEESLGEIVKRHEALRTRFSMAAGEPVQIICPQLNLKLQIVDLSDRAESEREDEARKQADEEVRQRFNLTQGPLLRVTLLRLADQDHVLVLILHHIVADGWSMAVLQRELSILYQAFSSAQPSPLPDLPIQYADFAVWQRQWLQGEVLESQLSYWKKQLEGAPAVLNLPMDRPRPPLQSFRGARRSLELSKGLTRDLKNLSRQNDVTLFMTLLAAFQTLLYRYTGQEDVVVGSPIANRSRSEIENLIGFFVNTLVLRSNLAGDPSFRDLLARVREVALEAFAHQDLPFEKLVEDLNPERNLNHSPLFQVMFVLQNASATTRGFGGLTFQSFGMGNVTAKFDLTLSMREEADVLRGSLEYSTDLFDAATIDRLIGHFQSLLQEIVSNPDRRISDLLILTTAEKQQLLVGWNDTNTEYPKDKCIHELFEAQAEKSPDRVAVVFEDQRLTYQELNERANQVARYLRKQGVGLETLVAICMERSIEMIVGLLAILKAGSAYVPLDPEYPKERLAFMLEDSQVSVLLTQGSLVDDIVSKPVMRSAIEEIESRDLPYSILDSRIESVCLDRDWDAIARENLENPSSRVTAGDLAYVIFTSGSTGWPKGVMISHGTLVNHMVWMQRRFEFGPADGVVQKTPVSFDASVWELFAPLISGARLILARPRGYQDSGYLVHLIQESGATVLQVVPSMLRVFLEEQEFSKCATLRLVFCGGETLTGDVQKEFFQRLTCPLNNLYGPTEAAIDATHWECERNVDRAVIPIGRPIDNAQIYILDSCLNPVPVGVPGELHIGGAGLARGYLNQPELTAEKFIPNPFNDKPGARLYRTGDLARYLPDGNIEFLGRIDNQVKIRGYRIELGEIEAALAQHPAVRECVVIAQQKSDPENPTSEIQNPKLDKRLVAYVALKQQLPPTVSELCNFIRKKLPEYMVPCVFIFLDTLPLTANGKVNRQALPMPDQSRPDLEYAFVAAQTAVEKVLARIWGDILKLERVGIYDNFFELGGQSLLATQVMSRINRALRIESPLRTLFEAPTIAGWVRTMFQNSDQLARAERRAELFLKVDQLSDDQVERMLNQKREHLHNL